MTDKRLDLNEPRWPSSLLLELFIGNWNLLSKLHLRRFEQNRDEVRIVIIEDSQHGTAGEYVIWGLLGLNFEEPNVVYLSCSKYREG